RTRWYGLPRDVDGDGQILATPLANVQNANELVDVVPVADVLRTAYPSILTGAVFEREVPVRNGNFYANGPTVVPANNTSVQVNYSTCRYTWVWQDSAPAMLRILVKMEDPAGHLPDGQWFEYVLGTP